MVAPGFLTNPEVRRWLGGVEPAWTLLEFESFNALREEPSRKNRALSLASDLTDAEIAASAVTRSALILLERAHDGDGLKLTATGNLSRNVVAEMIQRFEWPGFKPAEMASVNKVINEPDFLPLHVIRQLAQAAKLVRRYRGALRATDLGNKIRTEEKRRALQAILFHLTFWHADLSYFGRGMLGTWPKPGIGVLLWSLSVAAGEWQTSEKLTRLCTIPVNGVLDADWDVGSVLTEARVLRLLVWFGILDHKVEKAPSAPLGERHLYRKAPLFDRFLAFNVRTEKPETARH
jgi:hypothetical protein